MSYPTHTVTDNTGLGLTFVVFFVLCVAYFPPLVVDLSQGMAKLSNTAMAVAAGLLVFILLAGPTHYLMGGITRQSEVISAAYWCMDFAPLPSWMNMSATGSRPGP